MLIIFTGYTTFLYIHEENRTIGEEDTERGMEGERREKECMCVLWSRQDY